MADISNIDTHQGIPTCSDQLWTRCRNVGVNLFVGRDGATNESMLLVRSGEALKTASSTTCRAYSTTTPAPSYHELYQPSHAQQPLHREHCTMQRGLLHVPLSRSSRKRCSHAAGAFGRTRRTRWRQRRRLGSSAGSTLPSLHRSCRQT